MKIDHKESFSDFGKQFSIDKEIDGYWGSKEMLNDIVFPFNLNLIKVKKNNGSRQWKWKNFKNLLFYQPSEITSIEPSEAIEVAKSNNNSKKIKFKRIKGEDIKNKNIYDFVFSLGVIHHIPNYQKVCNNIFNSLKKNGKFICWVYGYEGNELYILIFNNLRRLTILLPDFLVKDFMQFFELNIIFLYFFM